MCKNHNHNHSHKISKFGDFISENKVIELILEGNLMASENFLKRLNSIKENPIANILHQNFYNKQFIDKNLSQNWIDVSDKDDFITFMADRGAERLNNSPDAIFSAKGRNEIKVGRFARAILTELGQSVTDKDIEIFVNTYKAGKEDNTKRFELVSGPIIKKYYLSDNYASNRGTLGDSCMAGSDCQVYFKLYTKNPDVCQLLVYLNENGKVMGRALVWKLNSKELYDPKDQKPTDCPAEYFMDRVYTNSDSDIIKFVNYAKENGWLYKWRMTADDREGVIFKYGDRFLFGKIIVKASRCVFRKYPFVDTLNFCDGDSYISNVGFAMDEKDDDAEEGFIMQDTDGGSDPCSNCDGTGYDDDDSTDCRKCNGDGELSCPECRGGGEEICKKCDGDGTIACKKCDGNGNYDCPTCQGNGDMECKTCRGDGYKECVGCKGSGDMGDCKRCDGDSTILCPSCKEEPVTCKICLGATKIVKKWGASKRRVTCPGCAGEGKSTSGDKNRTGCKCDQCSTTNYDGGWTNTGTINCPDCDGDGRIPCLVCKDKEGSHDPGQIECEDCDGRGEIDCTNRGCSYGTISCAECDGDGNTGDCGACDGDGKLGKCKNPKCDNGNVKCVVCNGSGDRPKEEKRQLCPDCAGILDVVKADIKSDGDFHSFLKSL